MEPPRVTPHEENLSRLWRAIVRNEAPGKAIKRPSGKMVFIPYTPAGLNWMKQILGEGMVFWLSQGSKPLMGPVPGSAIELNRNHPDETFSHANIPGENLDFSPLTLEFLSSILDWESPISSPRENPSHLTQFCGDILIQVICGTWVHHQIPSRFPSFFQSLDPKAQGLITLLTFSNHGIQPKGNSWEEKILHLISPRLACSWKSQWGPYHSRLAQARSGKQVEEFAAISDLFVSLFEFVFERKRLDYLAALIIRLASSTLAIMNGSEAFSFEIDWNTIPVVARQAIKRRSHLSFALGGVMERHWRKWRKTGYLSDEYQRAQEVMALFQHHEIGSWRDSVRTLAQQWSDEVVGGVSIMPFAPGLPSES